MSDIVERLRSLGNDSVGNYGMPIASEAADEIERLREEVKLLNSFRPDAELARLRGLLREWLVVGSLLQGNDKIVFSDLVDATKAALTTPCQDE